MEFEWMQVDITPIMDINDMPMAFVAPVIEEVEASELLSSFHFLHEWGAIRFRIKMKNPAYYDRVRGIVTSRLTSLGETSYIFVEDNMDEEGNRTPYIGESSTYGPFGWPIMEKSLEMSSRLAIMMKKRSGIDRDFLIERMLHCFLNAQGFSLIDEVNLQMYGIRERVGVLQNFNDKSKIDDLKQQLIMGIETI